jgi:CO/xanthine dehydrogenase FAD-binding subunit
MTIIFRPNTLAEALRILARPVQVVVTAGGPPIDLPAGAMILDTSRIQAMSGVQQLGEWLQVGVNTTYAAILRSRLFCPDACCLMDACAIREVETPGGTLLHDLLAEDVGNVLLLGLITLEAEVELAWLDPSAGIQRQWYALARGIPQPPEAPHLLLNVRFRATGALRLPSRWPSCFALGIPIKPSASAGGNLCGASCRKCRFLLRWS